MHFGARLIAVTAMFILSGAAQAETAQCDRGAALGPVLDTILALAPAPNETLDVAEGRRRAPAVRWSRNGRANEANGRLGEIRVSLSGGAASRVAFRSIRDDAANALVPALEARGAATAEIACLDYGPAVTVQVYQVKAPGKAPFLLTVTDLQHRPGSLPPEYSVVADFNRRAARFEDQVDERPGWRPSCG